MERTTGGMSEEEILDIYRLLDDAVWDLDGLTNEGEGVLDDFELGQAYAALSIANDIKDRFLERNMLDEAELLKGLQGSGQNGKQPVRE